MVDPALLAILCCPETHQGLNPADPDLVQSLNERITAGQLRTRAGQLVKERIDGGLLRSDGRFLYPVRRGIAVMLIDESFPIQTPALAK